MNLLYCQHLAQNTEDDNAAEFILHINGLLRPATWLDPWLGLYRLQGEDGHRLAGDKPNLKCERTKTWRKTK